MASWIPTVAAVGMAVGPPLVYVDQAVSIVRKKDSTGFSRDVCAILLIANITRCFFWLGDHFEFALLMQSILMIIAQLALLYICVRYRPRVSPENFGASSRPLSFWQWHTYAQYIEFLAGYIRSELYVMILGFVALGLESTLPIPQLISNYKQRSLYGFRASTLLGWVGGDSFNSSALTWGQNCVFFPSGITPAVQAPPATLEEGDDVEQEALALSEE
ncbi:hypothetical protein EDB19DRAFT_1828192 [Suillus lakei]|nr:hypothetical protein EDB19DRAFT_1828192 [Suillus lakei]